jgi:transposase InsO family protein
VPAILAGIDRGIYQYTSIDDCTHFIVLYTYSHRKAKNSMDFLERVIEQIGTPMRHFAIQRIQTDRGKEFFAVCFQQMLLEYCIAAAHR